VAIVAVIAIGFLGYRALYGGGKHEAVAVSEPPKSLSPTTATPAAEPTKDAVTPVNASAEPAAPAPTSPPAEEAPPKTAATSPAATQDALPAASAKAPRSAQSKAAAKTEVPTAEAPPAPAPPPKVAPKTTVAAAATPAVAQRDHWELYAEAVALCKREDFFKRIGCELRTRNQYCEGYWGKVAQCPEATPRDRGQ
jgi:hypothetical protein